MKHLCFFILVFSFSLLFSQDKHLLYNQKHNPQALLLNPGLAYESTHFHVSLPVLSNFYASVGNTSLSVDDIFNSNPINSAIEEAISGISKSDFVSFSQKAELFQVGWKFRDIYFSTGAYQESYGVINFPEDILELAYFGNAGQNRSYDFGQINFKANLQTVFHFGMNKKVNDKLHLGARAKLYTSSFNARSQDNRGQFNSLEPSSGLLLEQSLTNLSLNLEIAGLDVGNEYYLGNISMRDLLINDVLFGLNMGFGVDVGLSYRLRDNLEITASLLDLGFINFSNDVEKQTATSDYDYDGLSFLLSSGSISIPRLDLLEEFEDNVPVSSIPHSYLDMQPAKVNLGLTYEFGSNLSNAEACNCFKAREDSTNQSLSVHGFGMLYAGNFFYSLNAMYQRSFWESLYAKISLGTNQYNTFNYGASLALDVWKVNVFMNINRLNEIRNVYFSKSLALQFGMNFKF